MSDDGRPDPEDVLRRVVAEELRASRGRLTVFFGAAPGVGKTYAMLEEARAECEKGRDVVIGIAEAHGRYETAALVLGLELLPKRRVQYRTVTLEEFDLDAALRRKPSLVVLDELAHTNAEGSRHPKRWQDVEELLAVGIDVFTTLNVQHVETLSDVVAQVTGIAVRETVPDSVIEGAHEVRLIDLPPDDLLARLGEGKVYVPSRARHAIANFFRKGNLIALRELALRFTAEHVDEEARQYRKEEGIDGTWAISERIAVCVSWSPLAASVVRGARRMARRLRAPWYAVYVETPAHGRLSDKDRASLAHNLRLAENLGGEVITLRGEDMADEILRFAREHNVTRIVVGKPRRWRLADRIRRSFVDDLVRNSGDIDVLVTVGDSEGESPPPSPPTRHQRAPSGFLAAAGIVALATAFSSLVFGRSSPTDVVMLYLLGIVFVSMRFAFAHAMVAAVLSVLAFDFFFVPPFLTFAVSDFRYITTFGVMLLVATVIGGLTRRVRVQADAARERERRTASLYALSRQLGQTAGREALIDVAMRHIAETFDGGVVLFAPDETGNLQRVCRHGDAAEEAVREDGIVRWVWDNGREAGLGTDTLQGALGLYLPLRGPRGKIAVLGLIPRARQRLADLEQRQWLERFVLQLAMALERAQLADETESARMETEREQVRSTLLSSVSHDLRTPLAVVTGVASTLLGDDDRLDAATRRELLQSVFDEADRLDRLVRNLLDMTRLESGGVRLQLEWQPLEEVIGTALGRLHARLRTREVFVGLAQDLPLLNLDAVLMEQVLVNLLENAIKYTPAGSPLAIVGRCTGQEVVLEILDNGPGIAPGDEERIFEKFYRSPGSGGQGGVGLGLTICRTVVGAHGGGITARTRGGGGAAFEITLPCGDPPPQPGAQEELL